MKALFSATVPPAERLLNGLSLLLIGGQLALILGYYTSLPDSIPVHFGWHGKPDRWGGRGNLFIVPSLSLLIFLLFWAIRQVPADSYNMPKTLTPENRDRQVRNTHEMLAMLALAIMIFMLWTLWYWLDAVFTSGSTPGKWLPIVSLLLSLAGITIFYVRRAYRRV